jgi:hypothetical protein
MSGSTSTPTTADGTEFTTSRSDHRSVRRTTGRVCPPSWPRARSRHFVGADGTHRTYTFERGEQRVLDAAHVQRQLNSAGYPKSKGERFSTWDGIDPR